MNIDGIVVTPKHKHTQILLQQAEADSYFLWLQSDYDSSHTIILLLLLSLWLIYQLQISCFLSYFITFYQSQNIIKGERGIVDI